MKCKALISVIIFLIMFFTSFTFKGSSTNNNKQETNNSEPEIVPGVVVIKLKSTALAHSLAKGGSVTGISSLDSKLHKYDVLGVEKMFKHKPIPTNSNIPDISRIVKVQIPEDVNPLQIIHDLKTDPNIEYAEPVYKRYFFDEPNDPKYPEQDHFQQIKAEEAWDIQKGDSGVIIAIADSGFDLEHEDLKANVWINELERNGIAGIDDDGNGFIDDINGWDFGEKDNDVSGSSAIEYHGTGCAGIASAVTDNNLGVSGVSWNCRFLPIKISKEEVFIGEAGYLGIIYAADNNADVISLSWGGFGFSEWEQDVINYAYNKGSIIVSASGNIGKYMFSYPASYQNSVSVSAVQNYDRKIDYSSFGPAVDVSAPSTDNTNNYYTLLTTHPDNKYGTFGGTSGSCPVVAGVFGLVKSHYPDWTNEQIIRQVLLSADDLNQKNPLYINQLGHGRVNAYKALTLTELPEPDARFSVFSYELNDSIYGDNDNIPEVGETVILKTIVNNHSIGSTNSASFVLSSTNLNIDIVNGNLNNIYFPADTMLSFEFSLVINGITDAAQIDLSLLMQSEMGYSREEKIPMILGTTPLLFINHDMGQVESFYLDILEQSKVPFTYWDFKKFGLPNSKTIENYPLMIMCEEASIFNTVTLQTRNKIKAYLDSGGNLLISGQNIGYSLWEKQPIPETKEFMRNYLHAYYVEDKSSDLNVLGLENDPIGENLWFNILQPLVQTYEQSPDVIKPTIDALSVFRYGDGRTAAVKYSGDHKVIYLGFGLEAIDSDENTQIGDMSPIRTEVLMRSLNWLNFIEHKQLNDIEDVSVPRIVLVSIGEIGPDVKSMTLNWREKGESEFSKIIMAKNVENYLSEIPATNKSASIEYYIESEHEYYNWQSPVGAPDRLYSYYAGPDTIKPEIFVTQIPNSLSNKASIQVEAIVTDNFSVDTCSVYVQYRLSDEGIIDSMQLTPSGEDAYFSGEIAAKFNFEDVVEYRITAKDQSSIQNFSVNKWQSFKVGYEDFENGLDNWIAEQDGWSISGKKHGGINSVHCSPESFYDSNLDVSLTTKNGLDLSELSEAYLTCWSTYRMEENKDFGYIKVSTDNGNTWQLLKTFSGSKMYWAEETISLNEYAGDGFDNVLLRFQFVSDSTQAANMYGWFIDDIRINTQPAVSVEQLISDESNIPQKFELNQNYPNPFNPSTTIKYEIPNRTHPLIPSREGKERSDRGVLVTLNIYDILGREVATLVNEQQKPGYYEIVWNAGGQPSGIYFFQLKTGNFAATKKMILLR